MDKRHDCQQILGVLFCHRPIYAWFVGGRITEHAKGSAHEICKSALFTTLATGRPRIYCEQGRRSEEHTSELQSLMRISYAVFCLKKKKISRTSTNDVNTQAITKYFVSSAYEKAYRSQITIQQ